MSQSSHLSSVMTHESPSEESVARQRKTLWKNQANPCMRTLLIFIYLLLGLANIQLKKVVKSCYKDGNISNNKCNNKDRKWLMDEACVDVHIFFSVNKFKTYPG